MSASQNATSAGSSEYIYGIDLVRFACAAAVAAFHLTWMTPGIAWSLPFGWVGVEVFFVISGLVIANSANGATTQRFLAGRFLRIYPAAWCAALVNYALYLWEFPSNAPGLIRLYYSMTLLPGIFLATAYWTLPIELAFYFLIYSLLMFRGFRHIERMAILLIVWGAPYLLTLALNSAGRIHWAWVDFDYGWKNLSLLRHGPYFGLGILIWLYRSKKLGKMGMCAAGLAMGLGCLEIYSRAMEIYPNFGHSPAAQQAPWAHLAIAAMVAFCVAMAAILLSVQFQKQFPANPILRKAVRLLGLTTYPLYLLHERVGAFFIVWMGRMGMAPLACAMVALIATAMISLAIAWYCEPALRTLLKRIGAVLHSSSRKPALEAA